MKCTMQRQPVGKNDAFDPALLEEIFLLLLSILDAANTSSEKRSGHYNSRSEALTTFPSTFSFTSAEVAFAAPWWFRAFRRSVKMGWL